MRRIFTLAFGAGVGYVLGTRAGRGRYLEMKNALDRAMNQGPLSQVSSKLGETKIGETLGMKSGGSSSSDSSTGASYGTGSTWGAGSSGSMSSSESYTTGTQTMAEEAGTSMSGLMDMPESSTSGDYVADVRDSADDNARGLP